MTGKQQIVNPAEPHLATAVSRARLETHLQAVQAGIANPAEGIFGARSISWRINRESALFLAAGRAALLQLAHPWVAAALDQHSSLLQKPIERFHNTFRVVFTMTFGTADQAFRAARSLHQRHTRITGELPDPVAGYSQGSSYDANQIPALRWVFATLVDSAVVAYESVLSPLSDPERESYYFEARTLAALFGLSAQDLPPDWKGFGAYMLHMYRSQELGVSDRSRYMAHRLLTGSGSWVPVPGWYRALTTEWLPPRLRAEFGLRFDTAEEVRAHRARRWLPHVYPMLPKTLRFVGPYQEGHQRLVKQQPGFVTRRINKFWIGQELLPFHSSADRDEI